MPTTKGMERIKALRAELAQAEMEEREAAKARRASFVLQWKYTIEPSPVREGSSFDKMYHASCMKYRISRTLLNKQEAEAADIPKRELTEGGMDYIVNVDHMRIVCTCGGGSIYITEEWHHRDGEKDGADDRAMLAIGEFLKDSPEGGDITHIVLQFEAERASSSS